MSRSIHSLNNDGVDRLCRGRFDEAITCFRLALKTAKKSYQTTEYTHHDLQDTLEDDFVLGRYPVMDSVSQSTSAEYGNNMFDIYRCGFYLPKTDDALVRLPALTSVVLYNIGLSYHLASVTDHCKTPGSALKEGLGYYKLALATLKSQPKEKSTAAFFVLFLGCLTNMGHIFCHFWNRNEAHVCRVTLDRMLYASEDVPLTPAEEDFFFSTTLFYCSDRMQSPAPAA